MCTEIKTGLMNTLRVVRKKDFGVYLAPEGGDDTGVLLPAKQVPEGLEVGDEIEVFVYRDSSDRLISTVRHPLITIGQVALLEVAQVNQRTGAFLSMGLERDLLLPFREQTFRVQKGDRILVAMYEDRSRRLAATMRIYPYLRTDSPYSVGDEVTGRVYERSRDFGLYVAVDDMYSARIPHREDVQGIDEGSLVKARVTRVLEDGKLDLSPRGQAYAMLDGDGQKIMDELVRCDGFLPLHDKSSPEEIKERLHMSKAAFKRAAGHLYRDRRIVLSGDGIRLIEQED